MPKFEPIPLSRDYGCPSGPCEASPEGLSLFVSDPRVVDLPEEGCITFRYRRGPATIREPFKGSEGSASVDLTLLEICDVKAENYDEPKRALEKSENAIDKLFEEARDEVGEDD